MRARFLAPLAILLLGNASALAMGGREEPVPTRPRPLLPTRRPPPIPTNVLGVYTPISSALAPPADDASRTPSPDEAGANERPRGDENDGGSEPETTPWRYWSPEPTLAAS